jgi:hypothetical protein
MTSLLQAKKLVEEAFLKRPDVIGVGVDEITSTIKIYIDCEEHCDVESIPGTIGGYAVEIIPIGAFEPLSDNGYRTLKFRPVVGGISAGHMNISTGTIGAVVRDKITGNKLLLSNNHVFANSSSETNCAAREGDQIFQPGRSDGGGYEDTVATLYRWVPFKDNEPNLVDAALAIPINQDDASLYILASHDLDVVPVHSATPITKPITVKKYSRTSDMDVGKVIDWNFSVAVDYKDGITRNFVDQILVKIQTQGGDSGSLLLDDDNNAVGLIFAGGEDNSGNYYGVANKIRNVLVMFGGDVDISDGWSSSDPVGEKPLFVYENPDDNPGSEPVDNEPLRSSDGISLSGLALAGAGLVLMSILVGG